MAWVVVNLVCKQWRTSTTSAQASYSRLGESCRISYQVLNHACRPGNQYQDWAIGSFAQTRMAHLSESRGNLNHFLAQHLSQARGFGVLSDKHARLGENGSPKRGRDENWCLFDWILVQARSSVCIERLRVSLRREELA